MLSSSIFPQIFLFILALSIHNLFILLVLLSISFHLSLYLFNSRTEWRLLAVGRKVFKSKNLFFGSWMGKGEVEHRRRLRLTKKVKNDKNKSNSIRFSNVFGLSCCWNAPTYVTKNKIKFCRFWKGIIFFGLRAFLTPAWNF